jgi:hypothetical protein
VEDKVIIKEENQKNTEAYNIVTEQSESVTVNFE